MLFTKVREVLGGNLKFCVGGGAYLDPGQQDFFYALNIPVYQGYGLTEASPIISSNCEHTHKIGTAGKLIDNIECSIRHFNGNSVNQGEKGQIWIRGDNVMKGYFKNPKTTWETIQDGWLNTGDIGYLDDDDFLVVVGREKALLISQDGEKYSPEGIEEAIKNVSEFIHQVMIYNDHRKYTIALATLDLWQVQRYAHTYHMHSPEQLLGTIIDSFYSFTKIQTYAQMFPSKWIPVVFRILEEEFSEKNKMINSTMKMVRPTIIETYSQEIEDMYTLSNPSAMNPQNLQVVQKIMQKHA
jgi:long-chain acyl-CoA synthetase